LKIKQDKLLLLGILWLLSTYAKLVYHRKFVQQISD